MDLALGCRSRGRQVLQRQSASPTGHLHFRIVPHLRGAAGSRMPHAAWPASPDHRSGRPLISATCPLASRHVIGRARHANSAIVVVATKQTPNVSGLISPMESLAMGRPTFNFGQSRLSRPPPAIGYRLDGTDWRSLLLIDNPLRKTRDRMQGYLPSFHIGATIAGEFIRTAIEQKRPEKGEC